MNKESNSTKHWYKHAVIYAVDVETFLDGNGDGVGDFTGLINCLDYFVQMGVNCLWILPFYASPDKDNRYDVMDYYKIHSQIGTLEDFKKLIQSAKKRDIRIIIDLIVNHTSNQHPWFQWARADRHSPYRNYYVWVDTPPEDTKHEQTIFPDVEPSVWTYDEQAHAYYYHKFYHHEPDLNVANPAVQEEIYRIIDYWLDLGIAGFRVDAAPHLLERKGIAGTEVENPEEFLQSLHKYVAYKNKEAILLAETDVTAEQIKFFFGDSDRMHMLFNFLLNNSLFLALARQQAAPLVKRLGELPMPPPDGQWANFVRNLDELDLEQLSESERKEVFAVFAPEPNMQIYGRGIRRRVAPMLKGDVRRMKLTFSLLFTFPGTPVIVYGDEIGMGDNLSLPERNSVRTTMQWSDSVNGGFSTAPPAQITLPTIEEGNFSYKEVNVASQLSDPHSLLCWMIRAISVRRQCPEIAMAKWFTLPADTESVLAHGYQWNNASFIALHNMADAPCEVVVKELSLERGYKEIFNDTGYTLVSNKKNTFKLSPYGFRWFRAERKRAEIK